MPPPTDPNPPPQLQPPPDYTLHKSTPPVQAYINLRTSAGLSPVTRPQASAVAGGTWYGVYITCPSPSRLTPDPAEGEGDTHPQAQGEVVAMGRIISDGGWYFHIVDMAVSPAHQRRGLGRCVLGNLLERIRECAPEGRPVVNLFADPPGRRLYEGFGFLGVTGVGKGEDGEGIGEVGMVLPRVR